MTTLGEIRVPLERYDVMVQRWGFPVAKVSVPAFDQQDAINRITGEASQRGYYCFIEAYAPETGSGRREDNGNNGSSNS